MLSEERRKINNEEMNNFYPSPAVLESLSEGELDVQLSRVLHSERSRNKTDI